MPTSNGVISFVGAGPGAPDLITLRGAERLRSAQLVIWASSLVPQALIDHCGPDALLFDSKSMTLEDVTEIYAAHGDARIVRLHSGDPTIYSAIAEQIDWCIANHRTFEIVPGVSSVAAAAAAAGQELTVPQVSQSVVLTRLASRTAASMPEAQRISAFAATAATMAIFLSAARPAELQHELLDVGSAFTPDTPAVIAWRVSWPDERIVHSTVGTLARDILELGEKTTVMVLVGEVFRQAEVPLRAHVYSPNYAHSFRSPIGGSADE